MIALVAIRCGAKLATSNTADFQPFLVHGLIILLTANYANHANNPNPFPQSFRFRVFGVFRGSSAFYVDCICHQIGISCGMLLRTKSEELFAEALRYIPGGVNSPVRAFRAVGGQPFFVNRAHGAHVFDVDGNDYVDYVGTWGPAILGHAHPKIVAAVQSAAGQGTSFGIPNPLEVTMARFICAAIPSVQKVRMCNSGTEACMSAIRLARGFTGRDKIIKFDGCYHGHADSLLVKAGSGALTFGNPDSAGVPAAFTQHTIVLPFNESEPVRAAFAANPNQIAGIIVEPVPGNAGLYLPKPGYLEFLREITAAQGALLIFDEVMTGLSPGAGRRAGTLRPQAGFELFWKNHRRRPAGRRVWRAGGNHGLPGAGRPGVSGRHVERQPAGDGGGPGRVGGAFGGQCLCQAGGSRRGAGSRHERSGPERKDSGAVQPHRLDVLRLFHRPAGA